MERHNQTSLAHPTTEGTEQFRFAIPAKAPNGLFKNCKAKFST